MNGEKGSVKGNEGLKKTGLRGLKQHRREEGERGKDSGQVRWSGCAICWLGSARFGDSIPRDLRQLARSANQRSYICPVRGREENRNRDRRRDQATLSRSKPFGECVTNDPRLDLRESRVRFCTLSLHVEFVSSYFVR